MCIARVNTSTAPWHLGSMRDRFLVTSLDIVGIIYADPPSLRARLLTSSPFSLMPTSFIFNLFSFFSSMSIPNPSNFQSIPLISIIHIPLVQYFLFDIFTIIAFLFFFYHIVKLIDVIGFSQVNNNLNLYLFI